MKKLWLFFMMTLMPLWASADVAINEENFPDENFRVFLKEQPYGQDGIITKKEINTITKIDVSYKEIKSLEGVEFFTIFDNLNCNYNQLTSLDVSKNTALKELTCDGNQLTSLDVSNNLALKSLYCGGNLLTSLDVSKNMALTWLDCKHNQLTSLDVSGCTALSFLNCSNNKLANLDLSVSNNTALTSLYCYGNKIKGEAMDALVESLPNQSSAKITVIDLSNSSEENVCTTIQVNTAKEKGWKVYSHNLVNIYGNIYTSEVEYEGSDPSGIQNITLNKDTKTPVYNLNGMKLLEPRKGINIVGGKKVLVK